MKRLDVDVVGARRVTEMSENDFALVLEVIETNKKLYKIMKVKRGLENPRQIHKKRKERK